MGVALGIVAIWHVRRLAPELRGDFVMTLTFLSASIATASIVAMWLAYGVGGCGHHFRGVHRWDRPRAARQALAALRSDQSVRGRLAWALMYVAAVPGGIFAGFAPVLVGLLAYAILGPRG